MTCPLLILQTLTPPPDIAPLLFHSMQAKIISLCQIFLTCTVLCCVLCDYRVFHSKNVQLELMDKTVL